MLTLTCFWSCYRPTAWSWLSLRSFGRLRVWVSSIVMCGRSDVVCQILKTFVQIQVAARGWLSRCRVYERRFALTWYFHAVGCVSTGLAAAQVCFSSESESARVPWFVQRIGPQLSLHIWLNPWSGAASRLLLCVHVPEAGSHFHPGAVATVHHPETPLRLLCNNH